MLKLSDTEQFNTKKATRAALGEAMIDLADAGKNVYAVDADLTASTTFNKFAAAKPEYKDRVVNSGISEQNMIDVAAGLSLTGCIPFTGSFAVFGIGRAYEQIRNTVAYANLNVKLCPTHAGISVGMDGGSHQMLEDIALTRVMPNMRVLVPSDFNSAKDAIKLAADTQGPVYVRLGRANCPQIYACEGQMQIGHANVLREGKHVSILACGIEVAEALVAADILKDEGINAEVIDLFSIKPLDADTILASVKKTGACVVCEEHEIAGGVGSAVAELLVQNYPCKMGFIGIEDKFGKSGDPARLMTEFKLDAASIADKAKSLL